MTADPSNDERWLVHTATVLRAAGVRASPARAAVAQALARGGCLMSAQDVRDRLRGDASTSTVYRTLDLLHEHGLLRRVDAGDGGARYEPVDPSGDEPHQHVVFEDGAVEPFTDAALSAALAGLGERLGLEIDGYELIVHARRGLG
jgi:Fur family transcriptional regulator, ferric uptake regulator